MIAKRPPTSEDNAIARARTVSIPACFEDTESFASAQKTGTAPASLRAGCANEREKTASQGWLCVPCKTLSERDYLPVVRN